MSNYAKDWPSILCHQCKRDTPRSEITSVKVGVRVTLSFCPICYANRVQYMKAHAERMKALAN